MRLLYRIFLRLSLALIIVLGTWGILFYFTLIDEINDEVDDSLEDYSENIITRALAGQPLPSHSDGTNNSYYLKEISLDYADEVPHIRYSDEMVYIQEKKETEPARVLKTIFKDRTGRYFELVVSTPTIEKEDLQEAITNWVILLYLTLLILVLAINLWIFYGSMKPLYILLKWLDHYTVGQNEMPPSLKTSITEFRKLHTAAVRSVERNHEIFEQQKQFIGNASHELQTPLAICQNRLEMLAENEEITESQLNEINKIQQTLSYIIRLNKSLLLLSKIENGQFRDEKNICLNTVLHRQLEDYREIYSHKEIQVTIDEKGKFELAMNETLATTLINNLLKNAYVHNLPQGNIHICLSAQELTIGNTGYPEPLDPATLFRRFHQGKHAGRDSSGLGLSITDAICKLYQIRLSYRYNDKHYFTLSRP